MTEVGTPLTETYTLTQRDIGAIVNGVMQASMVQSDDIVNTAPNSIRIARHQ